MSVEAIERVIRIFLPTFPLTCDTTSSLDESKLFLYHMEPFFREFLLLAQQLHQKTVAFDCMAFSQIVDKQNSMRISK